MRSRKKKGGRVASGGEKKTQQMSELESKRLGFEGHFSQKPRRIDALGYEREQKPFFERAGKQKVGGKAKNGIDL
jgi:hypothetical protein